MFPQKHPFLPSPPTRGEGAGDEGLLMVGQALDRSVQEPNLFESQLANQLASFVSVQTRTQVTSELFLVHWLHSLVSINSVLGLLIPDPSPQSTEEKGDANSGSNATSSDNTRLDAC